MIVVSLIIKETTNDVIKSLIKSRKGIVLLKYPSFYINNVSSNN